MMIKIPQYRDIRIIKRFAWIPVRVGNYKAWLRFYYQTRMYEEGKWKVASNRSYHHPANGKIHSWRLW